MSVSMKAQQSLGTAILLGSVFAIASSAGAKDEWRPAGALPESQGVEPVRVRVVSGALNEQHLVYSMPTPRIVGLGTRAFGGGRHRVIMGNALRSDEAGKPILPAVPCCVALPQGQELERVEVSPSGRKEIHGAYVMEHGQRPYPLLPGARPRFTVCDAAVYGSDDIFPSVRYEVRSVQHKMGVAVVPIVFHPVEYRPKSGRLAYYEQVTVRVFTRPIIAGRLDGPQAKIVRYRPDSSGSLRKRVDNAAVLDTYETAPAASLGGEGTGAGGTAPMGGGMPAPLNGGTPTLPCTTNDFKYVVVTKAAFKDVTTDVALTNLVAAKTERGVTAALVTMEDIKAVSGYKGVDNAATLRNFIIDAYDKWGTEFVLLAGDESIVPMRKLWCESWAGGYVDDIPSDLYFQCLDGNFNSDGDSKWGEPTDGPGGTDVDLEAEIYVGRASAGNADEMANFVYKALAYENEDPSESYLRRVLMVGEYLGFGGVSEYATDTLEELRLGSSAHGYTTKGFASTNIFTVDTLYEGETTWAKDDIVEKINSEKYSIMNHLGHSDYNYCMKLYSADADHLANSNFLFVYSQGCDPGAFDKDCIGEHFTTSTRQGMFGVVFNSRYGWGSYDSTDGPSQRFNRQFWHAYFGEGEPRLGVMTAFSHEENLWNINGSCMRWIYYDSNLLGDPELSLHGLTKRPSLELDRLAYRSDATARVTVYDEGLSLTQSWISVDLVTSNASSGVRWRSALTNARDQTSNYFTNSISLASTSEVRAVEGDLLIAGYVDSGSNLLIRTAPIDDTPPVITNVELASVTEASGTIKWHTDEPADSFVTLSTNVPLAGAGSYGTNEYVTTYEMIGGRTQYVHAVTVTGLAQLCTYYVAVASEDYAGNKSSSPASLSSSNKADYLMLITQGRFISYENDMNGGEREWTATNVGVKCWEYGVPTYGPSFAYSGTNCWGTVLGGRYQDLVNASLESGVIHVDGGPRLRFRTWYDIRAGTIDYRDAGFIEVNDGSGWHNVTSNADFILGNYLQDFSLGWRLGTVDLANFTNKAIQIRFRLESDSDKITGAGWYIDDIEVSHVKEPGMHIASYTVEDASGGDGDGYPEKGETFFLNLKLLNSRYYGGVETNLVGSVGTATEGIDFLSGEPTAVQYGSLGSGEWSLSGTQIQVQVSADMDVGAPVDIFQTVTATNGGRWEHTLHFEIVHRVTISGVVTNLSAGAPIEGAKVWGEADGYPDITAVTRSGGMYDLHGFIEGVTYKVWAGKPGDYSESEPVFIQAPNANINFGLGRAYAGHSPTNITLTMFQDQVAATNLNLANTNSAADIPFKYGLSVVYSGLSSNWISLSTTSGVVGVGASTNIQATLNTSNMPAETVEAALLLSGNDISCTTIEVPVRIEVLGTPILALDSVRITSDDDADGFVEPWETIGLELSLKNTGAGPATNVAGTLSSTNVAATVVPPDTLNWATIDPDVAKIAETNFFVSVGAVTNGLTLDFTLAVTDGESRQWNLAFALTSIVRHAIGGVVRDTNGIGEPGVLVVIQNETDVYYALSEDFGEYWVPGLVEDTYAVQAFPDPPFGWPMASNVALLANITNVDFALIRPPAAPDLEMAGVTPIGDDDGDGHIEAGESVYLGITLANVGIATASNIYGRLSSSNANVTVVSNGVVAWPSIPAHSTRDSPSDFKVLIGSSVADGAVLDFDLAATNWAGQVWDLEFAVTSVVRHAIYGVVADTNGVALSGLPVTLTGAGGPYERTTDYIGNYKVQDLAPGSNYVVAVEPPWPYVSPGAVNVNGLSSNTAVNFSLPVGVMVSPTSIVKTVDEYQTAVTNLQIQNAGGISYSVTLEVKLKEGISQGDVGSLAAPAVNWALLDPKSYAPGRMLVRFKDGAGAAERAAALTSVGARCVRMCRAVPAAVVEFPPARAPVLVAHNLLSNPAVLYVEPDYRVKLFSVPDDARFSEMYGLNNIRQTGGTKGADIHATNAWDVTVGDTNVVIAVMDTGVDMTHEDLAANIWSNKNEAVGDANGDGYPGIRGFDDDGDGLTDEDSQGRQPGVGGYSNDLMWDDDENGYEDDINGWDFVSGTRYVTDSHGHGTHVAGTIAASGSNGLGVAGVAWKSRIMPLAIAEGTYISLSAAIEALEYAVDNGVKVSNNSWGGGPFSALFYEMARYAASNEHVLVCAAGNAGTDNDLHPFYPASYNLPNIIAVAATDHDDQLASFTCFGSDSVDIAAPGVNILSTLPAQGSPGTGRLDGQYGLLSGTSMAAPHVSGVAALLLSVAPWATAEMLAEAILAGGRYDPALKDRIVSGAHLDAAGALAVIQPFWIGLDPQDGTVPASNTLDVAVTLNAGGRLTAQGDPYEAVIRVKHGSYHIDVPVRITVSPAPVPLYVGVAVDDDPGIDPDNDGDGYAEPGETVDLNPRLANTGAALVLSPTGALASSAADVTITDAAMRWSGIPSGEQADADDSARVSFGTGVTNIAPFTLTVADATHSPWVLNFDLQVEPRGSITGYVRDASSSTGLAGVVVEYWGAAAGTTLTGSNGYYRIDGLPTNGVCKVRVLPAAHERKGPTTNILTAAAIAVDFFVGHPQANISTNAFSAAIQWGIQTTTNVVITNASADAFSYECYEMPRRKIGIISDGEQLLGLETALAAMGFETTIYTNNYTFDSAYNSETYQWSLTPRAYYSSDDAIVFGFDLVIADVSGRKNAGRLLLSDEHNVYTRYLERGGKLIVMGVNPLSRPDNSLLMDIVGAGTMDRAETASSDAVLTNPLPASAFVNIEAGDVLSGNPLWHDIAAPGSNGAFDVYFQSGTAVKLMRRKPTDGGVVYYWAANESGSNWLARGVWQDVLKNILIAELQTNVSWLEVSYPAAPITSGSVPLTLHLNKTKDTIIGSHKATVIVKGNYSGVENSYLNVDLDVVSPTFRAISSAGVTNWMGQPIKGNGGEGSSLFQVIWAGADGVINDPKADGKTSGDDVALAVYPSGREYARMGKGYERSPDYGLFNEVFTHNLDPSLDSSKRRVYVRAWTGASFESSIAYGDSSVYEMQIAAYELRDFGSWTVNKVVGYPGEIGLTPDTNGDSIPDGWHILNGMDPSASVGPLTATGTALSAFGYYGAGNGQFWSPARLFLTESLIFVLDARNNRLQVWDRGTEQYLRYFGSAGAGQGKFSSPYGMGKDPRYGTNRFAVADTGNNRIQVFTFDPVTGAISFQREFGSYGTGDGQFRGPYGLAIGPLGHIHVADTGNHRIQVFTESGAFVRRFGDFGEGSGNFRSPQGICVDSIGIILVADTENDRVQAFNGSGAYMWKFGARGSSAGYFLSPSDVQIGFGGRIFVADTSNHRFQIFDSSRAHLACIGTTGGSAGQLRFPFGVTPATNSSLVYVADTWNDRIQKFDTVIDGDRDGMDDTWEARYGLNPSGNDAFSDADGDGVKNVGEYRIGADPTSSDSDQDDQLDGNELGRGDDPRDAQYDLLRVTKTPGLTAVSNFVVRFMTESNKVYYMQVSTNLIAGGWSAEPGSIVTATVNGIVTYTNTPSAGEAVKFYRPARLAD